MKKRFIHLYALALYAILTVLMSFPAVLSLHSHVIGEGGDPWQTLWRFEYKAEMFRAAIGSGGEFFPFVAEEFLGGGKPRLINLSVWPWMPLYTAFGLPGAYNIVWLLSFILSGYGMFLLVLSLCGVKGEERSFSHYAAAFLAGALYMFLPYHIAHAGGHFGAMQTQWIPFIILLAISFFQKPRLGAAVGLGALLVVQAWTEHHYMLWLALFFLFALVFYGRDAIRFFSNTRTLSYAGVALAIFMVFGALAYAPTVRLSFEADSSLQLGREQTIRFSNDLFSYITPYSGHPLWGDFFYSRISGRFTGNVAESTQYLGIVPLALVFLLYRSIPKRQLYFWLGASAVFLLISLGPRLQMFGTVTPIALPYALIDSWPVFSSVRTVGRAAVMVGLSFAVLFGWVMASRLRLRQGMAAVLAVVLVEFLFFPVTVQPTEMPEVYSRLSQLPGSTVIEIPAATDYDIASRSLYASNIHGKEVLGNIALERAMDESDFFLAKSLPGVRQLLYGRTVDLSENRNDFFEQSLEESLRDALFWLGASAIIVHTDYVSEEDKRVIASFLEEEVRLVREEYGNVFLYDTSAIEPGDKVFAMRSFGWDHVGYDESRGGVFAEIGDTAELLLINADTEAKEVTLSFSLFSGQLAHLYLNDSKQEAVVNEEYVYTLFVEPGEHSIELQNTSLEKLIIKNPALRVL